MSNMAKILAAVVEPRTKREIAQLTGLSGEAIRNALNDLSRGYGVVFDTCGHGKHKHYYLPVHRQPAIKPKFLYQQILDLTANTGDWWSLDEMVDILDVDRHKISCSMRTIKRKYAKVEQKQGFERRALYRITI